MYTTRKFRARERPDLVTSFFTQFPDNHKAKHMYRIFNLYGNIVEVVIPPKRDKFGRRFGFARFRNVRDPKLFAIKLDNIIIGATKMHVNIPRFSRELLEYRRTTQARDESGQTKIMRRTREGEEGQVSTVAKPKDNEYGGGIKAPVEAMKKSERRNAWTRGSLCNKLIPKPYSNELCFEVSEEEMDRCKNMFVGIVKHPGTTHRIQDWFNMKGVFSVKVTPMGANKVLLEDVEEGTIEALAQGAHDWLCEWFDDIRRWCPDDIDN